MELDRIAVALDLATSLGLTPEDLRQLAVLREAGLPTLRQALHQLEDRGFAPAAARYPDGRRRVLDGDAGLGGGTALTAYGDLPYTELTQARLEKDTAILHRLVGDHEVARAAARGRPLAVGDPRLAGHGAAEQYVRAARAIDRDLVRGNFRSGPQLDRLRAPDRPGPGREKALEDDELRQYLHVVLTASRDPELDALLWVVARVAALRLTELLVLSRTGTKLARPSVTVAGKGSRAREMPVHTPVLRAVLALSDARPGGQRPSGHRSGGERPGRSGDALFRTVAGVPVTTGRFEDWSARLHRACEWARGHEIRVHALRHSTAVAVAARGGAHSDGAALYLGHAPGTHLGTVAHYLGLDTPHLWLIRTTLAARTFGPLDRWPDLPENDVLTDFLEMT
ncbi:tyrosine-type recombinase/integrase [Geodermatophilus sp. SYSU D00700]